MRLKIAIYNDTSVSGHPGCNAVMHVIKTILHQSGFIISYSWPYNVSWLFSKSLILKNQYFLINGEGTLHDDKLDNGGKKLIQLIEYLKSIDKIVIIINAELYNLSKRALKIISRCDYVGLRNKSSYDYLNNAYNIISKSGYLYDYSLFFDSNIITSNKFKGVVIDSVNPLVSENLKNFSKKKSLPYLRMEEKFSGNFICRILAIKKIEDFVFKFPNLLRFLCIPYILFITKNYNSKKIVNNFLKTISVYKIIYTGRFHGMTLAFICSKRVVINDNGIIKFNRLIKDLKNSKYEDLSFNGFNNYSVTLKNKIDNIELKKQWDHILRIIKN